MIRAGLGVLYWLGIVTAGVLLICIYRTRHPLALAVMGFALAGLVGALMVLLNAF